MKCLDVRKCKQNWEDIPAMFTNAELAEALTEDAEWRIYTYIRESVAQPGELYGFDCMIKFTKSDNTFKKVLRPIEV